MKTRQFACFALLCVVATVHGALATEPPRLQPNPLTKGLWYPAAAQRMEEQGRVLVSFHLDRNGKPAGVKLIRGAGFARLDSSAVKLVADAIFVPGDAVSLLRDPEFQATVVYGLDGDGNCDAFPNSIPVCISGARIERVPNY